MTPHPSLSSSKYFMAKPKEEDVKYIQNHFCWRQSRINLNPSIKRVTLKPDEHPIHSHHPRPPQCSQVKRSKPEIYPHLPLERVVGEVLVVRTEPLDTWGSMLSMWFLGVDNATSLQNHDTSWPEWLPHCCFMLRIYMIGKLNDYKI